MKNTNKQSEIDIEQFLSNLDEKYDFYSSCPTVIKMGFTDDSNNKSIDELINKDAIKKALDNLKLDYACIDEEFKNNPFVNGTEMKEELCPVQKITYVIVEPDNFFEKILCFLGIKAPNLEKKEFTDYETKLVPLTFTVGDVIQSTINTLEYFELFDQHLQIVNTPIEETIDKLTQIKERYLEQFSIINHFFSDSIEEQKDLFLDLDIILKLLKGRTYEDQYFHSLFWRSQKLMGKSKEFNTKLNVYSQARDNQSEKIEELGSVFHEISMIHFLGKTLHQNIIHIFEHIKYNSPYSRLDDIMTNICRLGQECLHYVKDLNKCIHNNDNIGHPKSKNLDLYKQNMKIKIGLSLEVKQQATNIIEKYFQGTMDKCNGFSTCEEQGYKKTQDIFHDKNLLEYQVE